MGPWWQAPTPVQKIGNNRAGWTQAMLLKPDGSLLHITSSGSTDPASSNNPGSNAILFNAAEIDLDRYEAENARQQGSAIMRDASMSNGGKTRLGAKNVGKLTFHITVPKAGRYALAVNYAGIGFAATPRLAVNGNGVTGAAGPAPADPDKAAQRIRDLGTRGTGEHSQLSAEAALKAGANTIEVLGGAYALDIDYLEVKSL